MLLFLFLFFHIICTRCSHDSDKIAVSMTTIPPRMSSIHHTITSWLKQTFRPSVINIVVPQKYKRFHYHFERIRTEVMHSQLDQNYRTHSKREQLLIRTPRDMLYYYVNKTHPIELKEGIIRIYETEYDYGPISKYMGKIEFDKECKYWIVGDDDVEYSSNLIERYLNAGLNLHKNNKQMIYTHFAPTKRLSYTINIPIFDEDIGIDSVVTNRRNGVYQERHQVPHIQGVDTVLFPVSILQQQEDNVGPLSYYMREFLIIYFHTVCPLSFYQDDYIISYLVYLSNLSVFSVWSSYIQVVNHIDNVSKSNYQMHMNTEEVVNRESSTIYCIQEYAHRVNDVLMMCNNDAILCDKLKKKLFEHENKEDWEMTRTEGA